MNDRTIKTIANFTALVFVAGFVVVVFFALGSILNFTENVNNEVVRGAAIEDEYGFYLSITLQDGVDIARFSVAPGSPMEEYGVRTDDQLLGGSIGDFYDDFLAADEEFTFYVLRDGEPIKIEIPIE